MNFNALVLTDQESALRAEVRSFLTEHRSFLNRDRIGNFFTFSPEFSRLLGQKGWIGMVLPKEYGGAGRTFLERYIITEELLAGGSPVAAHWIADRQSGPLLLRFGTEQQRMRFLPEIARGECYFAIGMSEPNSGSDLASIRSRAERVEGGWRLNGSKIWTSFAQHAQHMIVLCRTTPPSENPQERHKGMSQFILDLSSEGVTVRPIKNMAGDAHFCEVFFDDVFLSDDSLVGTENNGWNQVMAELAYERSGPDRFLCSYQLMEVAINALRAKGKSEAAKTVIGTLVSKLMVLRQMSLSVASQLQAGKLPINEASIVKDLGTTFEQEMAEALRGALFLELGSDADEQVAQVMCSSILNAPSFSLQGGTREVLRGIIAKGLGLR